MATERNDLTRRDFVKTSAALTAASFAAPSVLGGGVHTGSSETIRVGLIGCGGRGTGAAHNAIDASDQVRIVALADVFEDQGNNKGVKPAQRSLARRGQDISDDRLFVGFDAYKKLLAIDDIDYVIIATPPYFKPAQIDAAVNAGKHVFTEKPVASDPAGIRTVFEAAKQSKQKGLSVVAGTQRRHEACYQAMIDRIREGAIGDIVAARCWWNQGGLWVVEKTSAMSDMEWHIRNWLYFTWISGDHIVEQHVHNLDVCNWALDAHPVKCLGMGGRQVRTEPKYGNIFDHFAIEYEYPDGRIVASQCRQIDGCASRVAEAIHGTKGQTWSTSGRAQMTGAERWRYTGENPNPYVVEHRDLIASITGSVKHWNELRQVAESTLTAIMGRMSAYTGKEVTWEDALNSDLDLSPPELGWIDFDPRPVATPGRTPLV